jgi:hypothetical protein
VTAPPYYLLPYDDIALMPVHEQRQDERDEEEDRVHDSKRPRRLEHRTVLVDVYRPSRTAADSKVAERSECDVDGRRGEVRAGGVADAAELVVCCDEGADEAEVDEGDEERGAAGRAEADEGHDGPGAGEDGDDEEDEDVGWGE